MLRKVTQTLLSDRFQAEWDHIIIKVRIFTLTPKCTMDPGKSRRGKTLSDQPTRVFKPTCWSTTQQTQRSTEWRRLETIYLCLLRVRWGHQERKEEEEEEEGLEGRRVSKPATGRLTIAM